ncbi:MAG: membrane integrity-associated transporter subunit PqiC [Alphaproteobacteria bacterium]|nr:membrane integrity-associated transporter subunit PqiC [Alphaproteobacteria bacterium]
MRQYLVLVMLSALLSACALLSKPAPAPELYMLKPDPAAAAAETLPLTIRIALPEVAPGLDTARIAVLEADNKLIYYTGAAWAAPLPQLAQEFLSDAFGRSRAFRIAGSDQEPLRTDVMLSTAIHECQVDMSGPQPVIRLRLTATLLNSETHQALAAIPVEETVQAEANHMAALVAAFNKAFNAAAQTIIPAAAQAARAAESQREEMP